jgi:D-sedoheptulose 7-phosphate isomerase
MQSTINKEFSEHLKVSKKTMESIGKPIEIAAKICIDSLKNGNKILIFGNGGSAADAQHIAAEIVGRYKTERKGLSAIALTTDTSILTSISNDYGYLYLFKRQVEALANDGDVLIGISTGGTSANVVSALKIAKKLGCQSIGFSGRDGGEFNSVCDVNLKAIAEDTPRIQEMHILFGHIICHLIDQAFNNSN